MKMNGMVGTRLLNLGERRESPLFDCNEGRVSSEFLRGALGFLRGKFFF